MRIDAIRRVLVVGAGTMGHSIAMVFAQGGYEVDLVDIKEGALNKSLRLIHSNLQTNPPSPPFSKGGLGGFVGTQIVFCCL
jgi:3-hydroxyacyl-CoA dehydrogenase